MWIKTAVEDIAERIVRERERVLGKESALSSGRIESARTGDREGSIEPQSEIRVVSEVRGDIPVPKSHRG
jgi:hypothetical protein